jgi:hypothetical protein
MSPPIASTAPAVVVVTDCFHYTGSRSRVIGYEKITDLSFLTE